MLNRWQRTIVDLEGNVVPYAQLQIRVESTQAAAIIYADRLGTAPLPSGIVTADESGYAFFYAEADLYRISSAEPTIDWRYVDIGSAGALQRGNNLSDVTNPATARNNLGLGEAATRDIGGVGIGVGQTWQDMLSVRSLETNYTNTTGRSIEVSVAISSANTNDYRSGLVVIIDGLTIKNIRGIGVASFPSRTGVSFVVPPGSVYRAESATSEGVALMQWAELR